MLCDIWPLLFSLKVCIYLSCLKVKQWASSPLRLARAQVSSLVLSITDGSELNHGFDVSLSPSFLKGACLSIIAANELVQHLRACSTFSILVGYCISKSLFIKMFFIWF